MPNATLLNAVDTYATSGAASTNYAAATTLAIGAATTYSYLYFTRPMPLKAVVTSAKLRLFYSGTWSTTATVTAERLASSLTASRVTWNAKPGVVTGTATSVNAPTGASGTMIEVDVTAMMQTVANGAAWYGLRLSTPGTVRRFTSAEGLSAYRPQLYVAWSEQPQAPTSLVPDGNDAVSVTKPTVRFQVTDVLGDTTIAAVNVQTATNATFTAGLFDTDWVATDVPELDLSQTAFPAMTAGQSLYWRARVKDGAGLVSAWSDDAQMRYVAKGTLTLNNPAAAVPPDPAFITDPTAPIIWTFSGTQVQWRVTIMTLFVRPMQQVASSGQRTGTDNSWTIPTGVIQKQGDYPYRVRVEVWDNVDRDPNDAVASAQRDFVYTFDAATPGITGLAVSQPFSWPVITLNWSRATAPDAWVIERDGDVIEDNLAPEDALVSGTAYTYEDGYATPWVNHTWKVRAKVNGKVSDTAGVTYKPALRGIWLIDKGRGIRVWIAGADDGVFTRPEDATSVAPLGGTRVVRRVQGVRNYEGSITGRLVDAFGRTMQQYHADLGRLRDEPTRPVSLMLADYSLRVLLGNVQLAPTAPHVPPSRTVSFDFWQV